MTRITYKDVAAFYWANYSRMAQVLERRKLAVQACSALDWKKKQGRIPPASDCRCAICGGQAWEYHHHKGYAKEFWFDVIALCHKCHVSEDKKARVAFRQTLGIPSLSEFYHALINREAQ